MSQEKIYISGQYASNFCEKLKEFQIASKNPHVIGCFKNSNNKIQFYQNFRILINGKFRQEIHDEIFQKINLYFKNLMRSVPSELLREQINEQLYQRIHSNTIMEELELACRLAKYKPDFLPLYLEYVNKISCYPQEEQSRLQELLFICYSENLEQAIEIYKIYQSRFSKHMQNSNEKIQIILKDNYKKALKEANRIEYGILNTKERQIKLNRKLEN